MSSHLYELGGEEGGSSGGGGGSDGQQVHQLEDHREKHVPQLAGPLEPHEHRLPHKHHQQHVAELGVHVDPARRDRGYK